MCPIHDDLLIADFNQCFEHMRHYDEVFLKSRDFGFAGIVAVIGASAVLIEHFKATHFTVLVTGLLLFVSTIAGALLVASLARNRVYFAFVARYVNEIRSLYLRKHPGGFRNLTAMYSDYKFPKIFNPFSSHSIDVYFFALCVSLLATGTATTFHQASKIQRGLPFAISWPMTALVFLGSFVTQVVVVTIYWFIADRNKSAHGAVHGHESDISETLERQ